MTMKEAADFYGQRFVMTSCETFDSTQCDSIEKEESSSELSSSEDSSASTVANVEDGDNNPNDTDPSPSTAQATAFAAGDSFTKKGKKKTTASRLRKRIAKRSLSSVFRGNKDRDVRDVWRQPSPSKESAVSNRKDGKRRTSLADLFLSPVSAMSGGTRRNRLDAICRSLSAPSLSSSRSAKNALLDARGTHPSQRYDGGNEASASPSKSISKQKQGERQMIETAISPPSSEGTVSGSDVTDEEGGYCADALVEESLTPQKHHMKAKAKERRERRRGRKTKKHGKFLKVRRSSVEALLGRIVPSTAAVEGGDGITAHRDDGDVVNVGDGNVAIAGDDARPGEKSSAAILMPLPSLAAPLPPDSTLERMSLLLEGTLPGVSVRGFYDAWWSRRQGPCSFGSWLLSRGNHDVRVGEWDSSSEDKVGARDFVNEWCGESYAQKRTVSFKFKRTTHLYTGPPVADVAHTHHCRVEGTGAGDRCVVAMTVRMGGIPYADAFRVHIRWVASRAGATDLSVKVGVFVEFTKSCMFASKIRSGTMESTKAAQTDLFENMKRTCCGPCNYAGSAESDIHEGEIKAAEHIPKEVETCQTGSSPCSIQMAVVGTRRGTYLKACLILLAGVLVFSPCLCWLRQKFPRRIFSPQLAAPTMDAAIMNAQSTKQALRSLQLSVQDLHAQDRRFTQQRRIFLDEIEEMQEALTYMHDVLAHA